MNSVEETGDEILLSYRHLNTFYKISRSTEILWKIGGTGGPRAQLYKTTPVVNFSGNHDARRQR